MSEEELKCYLEKQTIFYRECYGNMPIETNIKFFQRLATLYRKHPVIICKHIKLINFIILKGVKHDKM